MNVMSNAKRLTALLLCAVLLLGLMPVGAFAAETEGETTAPTGETTAPTGETTAPADETSEPTEEDNAGAPEAQAEGEGTVTVPGSTATYSENVYVLTNTLSNNGTYLIVNTNAAGSGYALLNSNGSISAVEVTVNSCDQGAYIQLNNSGAVWTATGSDASWKFANSGSYLGWTYTTSSGGIFGSATNYRYTLGLSEQTWTLGTNVLYSNLIATDYSVLGDDYNNYYLNGGSSWSMSTSSANVYFYAPAESVTVTVPDVTYGITVSANGTTDAYTAEYVTKNETLALSTAFWTNPTGYQSGVTGGTYAWTSSNTEVATVAEGGTLTFTGKAGSTTVRVTYTQGEYVIWDEIVITAEPAGYRVQIVDGEKNPVDGTVAVKGDTAIAAGLDLNALVTNETSADESAEVTDAVVAWSVSDTTIATIDADGVLTFIGKEGLITVTASYTDPNGDVHEDTLNVSVSKSEYFTPNDGTNDFPEYPNEGAIRIDKNAQAVGNFSETGVAKVELSMTGVPYSAGNEIDVVIVIDTSPSMTQTMIDAAADAAIDALKAIVINEDGSYNKNRVAVYNFCEDLHTICTLQTFNATTLTSVSNKINALEPCNSGTNYTDSLKEAQEVLAAAKTDGTGDNREQYCIFVSDGGPSTSYSYLNNRGTKTDVDPGSGYYDYELDDIVDTTEYYSYLMKQAGVEVFTVSFYLDQDEWPNAVQILKNIACTNTSEITYSYNIATNQNANTLTTIFKNIVNAIKEAATNVTVTDKITDEYTLILETPDNVTLPDGTALTIDVKQYTLDADKKRTGDPVVIESIALDSDKVTKDTDGNILSINGEYFDYDAATQIITWKADKLDNKELALSYYVYLDNSAGFDTDDQTAAGTYPTNEYAYIDYTNHLDHQCRKEFPKPQLTWNGAQVNYTFYLVNSQGQPVNRAGRVVPFAEAVYVTEVYTESVTWDTDEDKTLDANLIASELLPDVYDLYDDGAVYTINVYEKEDGTDLNNHFIIANGDGVTNNTTKVFNTKAGTIYDAPATYTATGDNDTTKVHTGFDFANTTVAFAVVWKDELAEDSVVLDYGLDVIIDVTTNDALEAKVVGVRADAPSGVTINSGSYTAAKAQEIDVKVGDVVIGTATVENMTSVRFTLDKTNGMLFNEPVTFYYESEATYYNSNNVLQTVYLYSSVTIIPATTIYYEDSYVTLKTFTKNEDGTYTETAGWPVDGTAEDATQAQDRPGESKISADIDADNNYGYDAAYESMSKYSMGSAVKATVNTGKYATAEFEFYGTGFDVISLTDKTTGTIVVEVLDANGQSVLKESVNTYYGYKLDENGNWVATESGDVNALYQVPVIKIGDGKTTEALPYGKYKVVITATYVPILDSNKTDEGYNFYLDAIRVYNPTGNQNDTANDAYLEDGEAYPAYFELRDKIIEAATFDALTTDEIEGVVFIDGNVNEKVVSNYASYGPNNEVYLAPGQAISFELNATASVAIAKVQIALKSVGGSASVKIYSADGVTALDEDITTATDMYYDITAMNGKTVVIINDGDAGVLSITNVKVTYTADPNGTATTMFMLRRSSVNAALDTMNVVEPEIPEVTEPETTEPETTEPETTEPETTEPETTEPEETEPEETEPSPEEVIKKKVGKIIKKIFGWLFG